MIMPRLSEIAGAKRRCKRRVQFDDRDEVHVFENQAVWRLEKRRTYLRQRLQRELYAESMFRVSVDPDGAARVVSAVAPPVSALGAGVPLVMVEGAAAAEGLVVTGYAGATRALSLSAPLPAGEYVLAIEAPVDAPAQHRFLVDEYLSENLTESELRRQVTILRILKDMMP